MSFPTPTKYHHTPTPATDPAQPRLSVKGKNVVVTGGGAGIGPAFAEAFAKANAANIFLTGRRANKLEETAKKLSAVFHKTQFHSIVADISKEADVANLVKEANKIGPIDIFVANAGFLPTPGKIADTDTADWWQGFETNALGTYLQAKYFLNQSPQPADAPVFISVSSGVAHVGPAFGSGMSSYATSKLAGAQFVEFIAHEYPHVKAFALSPGIIATDMNRKSGVGADQALDAVELPAHFAVWLAGPDSDFLKGRFLWANWDVEELLANKGKIEKDRSQLRITLEGWNENFAKLK